MRRFVLNILCRNGHASIGLTQYLSETLNISDRLLVVGADEELAALAEFAKVQAAVPGENSACQWITVNADSPMLDKTLADIETFDRIRKQLQCVVYRRRHR
jgi:K+/H+ antiporter YhaU regulatory subunit KhtT